MDFEVSTSGFEARLCHLILNLFGIECCYSTYFLATATLPCFGLQYSISKKTRTTVSVSSMQEVFAESSLRKQTWRNPKEGRVGCLHKDIFTWKVTDIAFTADFCNNYSHPASASVSVLKSPVSRPQVPTHASRCPRPLVPVPLLYTAP